MRPTLASMAVILMLMTGCATTKRETVQQTPAICGFLGEEVCRDLTPGAKGEAGLRYVNPKAQPTQYNMVMIQMVGFFGADTDKVPPKDEQLLTDIFYKDLHEALAKKYQVVEQAGSGVMKVEVALLDAEAATAGARSISMVVPQLRVVSAGYALVAGKYPFAGGGQAAAKVTDSVTGEILGAGVDRRAGGGSIKTAAQWQWGDAENAIKAWSELIATSLYAYTSGERKP
jgi:hypothetical protein